MDRLLKFTNISMLDVYYFTEEQCDEYLIKCRWEGRIQSCENLFRRTVTIFGICCSFNFEENFNERKNLYTNYFGIENGLSVALKPFEDEYYLNLNYGNTFKVSIYR